MNTSSPQRSLIIIGAGITGLSAGVYAQMNGYRTRIYEMHSQAGGLCTAWKRKGYTVDGCIHWLVGSSPQDAFYSLWEEVGLIQGRQIIYQEEFMRYAARDGREFIFYTDLERLEAHLVELAPEDAALIRLFLADTRRLMRMKTDPGQPPELTTLFDSLRSMAEMLPLMGVFRRWGGLDMAGFAKKFANPFLREVFSHILYPNFSLMALMITMVWLQKKAAGYPLGGSLPMAQAVESRFRQLGGEIHYNARVKKILVEDGRAVGIRLENGQEERADDIISAADGHATLFEMLEGRYVDDKLSAFYRAAPLFPPIFYMGIGVNRRMDDVPHSVSGAALSLAQPITVAGQQVERLDVHVFNFDPSLAPPGKTVMTVLFPTSYEYWKERYGEKERYDAEKQEAALAVVRALESRFPGLERDVEMIDVATPVTFERYTGNWKASWEGWMITPQTMLKRLPKSLPGLKNFWMIGQWVQPGGGLPTGVMHGRHIVQILCRRDGKKFTAVSQPAG